MFVKINMFYKLLQLADLCTETFIAVVHLCAYAYIKRKKGFVQKSRAVSIRVRDPDGNVKHLGKV